jgi:hypothetical protein
MCYRCPPPPPPPSTHTHTHTHNMTVLCSGKASIISVFVGVYWRALYRHYAITSVVSLCGKRISNLNMYNENECASGLCFARKASNTRFSRRVGCSVHVKGALPCIAMRKACALAHASSRTCVSACRVRRDDPNAREWLNRAAPPVPHLGIR